MCFGFSKHKKDEDGNRQELWRFYEKAIDGRDSFYKHYVQYMNLYAIFTGAFFVAFYNVYSGDDGKMNFLLALLVSLMGLGTSCLWLCSVKGYYAWIINWITVVRHYEELLNQGRKVDECRFVYGLFYKVKSDGCSLLAPSRFSTQKLTMTFVWFTIFGWICIIAAMVSQFLYNKEWICTCIKNIIMWVPVAATLIFLLVVLYKCFGKSLKDDVESHYRLKRKTNSGNDRVEQKFFIHPPKNKGA